MDFTLSLTTETSRLHPTPQYVHTVRTFYHILQIWIQRHQKWLKSDKPVHMLRNSHNRIQKGYIVTLDNPGVKSSGRHAEYQFTLHFIARPYASVAIYTFGKIHGHIGMAKVFCLSR